jgi:hypothetical protein
VSEKLKPWSLREDSSCLANSQNLRRVALPLSDEGLKEISLKNRKDQDDVLLSIEGAPDLSTRERAQQLCWLTKAGDPYQHAGGARREGPQGGWPPQEDP